MGEYEWMNARDLAAALKVDVQTIRRLLKSGNLKAYKPTGQGWMVKRADFEAYLESTANTAQEGE